MQLGGNEIFADLFAKYITLSRSTMVYGWQDTEEVIDHRVENFLTVEDQELFSKHY